MKKRTMAEFMKNCREIMASGTDRDKKRAIDGEAERLLDDIIEDMPEILALRRRERELEQELAREIDGKWLKIRAAKKAKLIEKTMLAGKAV